MIDGHLSFQNMKAAFKSLFSKIPWFLPILAVLFSAGSALLSIGYAVSSFDPIPSSVSLARKVHREYNSEYIGIGAYAGYEGELSLPEGSIKTYSLPSSPAYHISSFAPFLSSSPSTGQAILTDVASYYLDLDVGDTYLGLTITSICDSGVDLEKLAEDYPLGTSVSILPVSYGELSLYVNEADLASILSEGGYRARYSVPVDSDVLGLLRSNKWLYLEYKGNNPVRSYAYSLPLYGKNLRISGFSILGASLVFVLVFFLIYGKTAMEFSHPLATESYWSAFGFGCLLLLPAAYICSLLPPLVICFCCIGATSQAIFPFSPAAFFLVPLLTLALIGVLLLLAYPISLHREKRQSKTLF